MNSLGLLCRAPLIQGWFLLVLLYCSSQTHTRLTAVQLLWHEIVWNRQSSEGQHEPIVVAGLTRSDLILTALTEFCSTWDTSTGSRVEVTVPLHNVQQSRSKTLLPLSSKKGERKSAGNTKSPLRGPRKNQNDKEESSRTPPAAPCSLLLNTASLEISFSAYYLTPECRP